MAAAREKFESEEAFLKAVTSLSRMTQQEISEIGDNQEKVWEVFQAKYVSFFPLEWSLHIFRKYVEYGMRKFIRNGYDRMEFRISRMNLVEYDEEGYVVKEHGQRKFMETVDEAYERVRKDHPDFSLGVIFVGLKFRPLEETEAKLTTVLEHKWEKTVGIDFAQQEDPSGSLKRYDEVADKVLAKFPYQEIRKVYHAG